MKCARTSLCVYVHRIEYEYNYNTVLYGLLIVCDLKICVDRKGYKSYKRLSQ